MKVKTKPNKIQTQFQNEIDSAVIELLAGSPYMQFRNEFNAYITDTKRGYCDTDNMHITIPFFAFDFRYKKNKKTVNKRGYFLYYVAHELSHMISDLIYKDRCHHDHRFYAIFAEICPKEYQHFELGYKPTSAKYGISK